MTFMNETPEKNYDFTRDEVSDLVDSWKRELHSFKNLPHCSYLEVGVFEGRSLLWFLENILTHEKARAIAIDPFFWGKQLDRFKLNLRLGGFEEKVSLIRDISQRALKTLPNDTFNLIYIDGDHRADSTIADCVLAWPLLKCDGIMIIDNYDWHQSDWSIDVRPQLAIDAFMTFYSDQFTVHFRSERQVMLRKIPPVTDKRYCSRIGQYAFFWLPLEGYDFRNSATGECFQLLEDERTLLMEGFKKRRFGEDCLDKRVFTDASFQVLIVKYKINLVS